MYAFFFLVASLHAMLLRMWPSTCCFIFLASFYSFLTKFRCYLFCAFFQFPSAESFFFALFTHSSIIQDNHLILGSANQQPLIPFNPLLYKVTFTSPRFGIQHVWEAIFLSTIVFPLTQESHLSVMKNMIICSSYTNKPKSLTHNTASTQHPKSHLYLFSSNSLNLIA